MKGIGRQKRKQEKIRQKWGKNYNKRSDKEKPKKE